MMRLSRLQLLGTWASFLLIVMAGMCSCNQMDPHIFPATGPFFEGWYMRIMDQHAGLSVGFLFSRILVNKQDQLHPEHPCIRPALTPTTMKCPDNFLNPRPSHHQRHNTATTATTSSGNNNNDDNPRSRNNAFFYNQSSSIPYHINVIILINENETSKLATDVKFFPVEQYSITQNGRPVTKNPDDLTPPHFEARIGQNVSFIVRPKGTKFMVCLGDTILRGETDAPVPWGPHGEGPESWIDKLPLPLHWFVYSLRSNVLRYEVINRPRGLLISGGSSKGRPVLAHMEKNWGAAFPKAWIWAQGVDSATNASFAVSSGLVTELGIDIPAQLSNYRNPGKNINCKFHPTNSVHSLKHGGCTGWARLQVTGLLCEVVFELFTKPRYLSDCLTTPQVYGYAPGCVESYNAVANITVYERHGLKMKHADSHHFSMAALEFGGEYMCKGKCPS